MTDTLFDELDIRKAPPEIRGSLLPYVVYIGLEYEVEVVFPTDLYPLIGRWAELHDRDPEFTLSVYPTGKFRLWAGFGPHQYPLIDYDYLPNWAKEDV